MESLGDILRRKQAGLAEEADEIERLKTYIEKKYGFAPEISLSPKRVTIYAPSSALASLLRLDWANLDKLSGGMRKIYVSLRKRPAG